MDAPWARLAVTFYRHPRTRRLSKDAQHLYIASILHCVEFSTDGRFPADETPYLASVSRVRSSLAEELFDAGVWIAQGDDEVLIRDFLQHQTSRADIEARSERNRKAADARWNAERNASRNAPGNAERNASREEESREEKTPPDPPAFVRFWEVYPSRVGKGAARKAWAKATKVADADDITESARLFADHCRRHGTEKRFIPHPATWLNREGWDDELIEPNPAQEGSGYR